MKNDKKYSFSLSSDENAALKSFIKEQNWLDAAENILNIIQMHENELTISDAASIEELLE